MKEYENLLENSVWINLTDTYSRMKGIHLRELFDIDANRGDVFSAGAGDLYLDYSKNLVTAESMALLISLAVSRGVEEKRNAMFSGEKINVTENRAVLHTALRNLSGHPIFVDEKNIMADILSVRKQMEVFSEKIRNGKWLGYSGKPITTIVNIGIGGSDLGPAMATEALKFYSQRNLSFDFVSNIDGSHISEILQQADPETTLFIIASKTFTTDETMTNAKTARRWITDAAGDERAVSKHFVALSTNLDAVSQFGINPNNTFAFWDFVGGRYSLPSAIGLSLMISIGKENFTSFLEGMDVIDKHFLNTPLSKNLPVILAVLGIWYRNFWGAQSHAVIPYDQYLNRFTAYLQQADMESNGKSVTLNGQKVDYQTSPIIWGEPGTNSQHAFFQLLHQGTKFIPVDFLVAAQPLWDLPKHHQKLVANCFAQSRALAFGRTVEELEKLETDGRLISHRVMPGNRPSNTIIFPKLTPKTLGQLIALYEHKIFVQGCIWGINSFDQYGVELGKELAKEIYPVLVTQDKNVGFDSSTVKLIEKYQSIK